MVDKNLFLYDLAVMTMMKNAAPYVKEWLDYHLLAGVDHFYFYDNESPDNQKEILQPYVDAGIVTYTLYPGKVRLLEAYNDAIKRFKFECRYLAFVDDDEFILPKSKPTIIEVVDEVLSGKPNAGGLSVDWQFFGSNGQEKADYSRGVLERFTARQEGVDKQVKIIVDPRKVRYLQIAHFAYMFDGFYSFNENGGLVNGAFNEQPTGDKIVMHHYHLKSREEYEKRVKRGQPDGLNARTMQLWESWDKNYNKVVDEDILKYRDERRSALIPDGDISKIFPRKQINYQRLLNVISQNLFQVAIKGTPPDFFKGKMENFLTCLNLVSHLKERVFEEFGAKFFEEIALNAIHKTLYAGIVAADLMLLLGEMPKILKMNYPIVKTIRESLLQIIPKMLEMLRMQNRWQEFTELEYKLDMLKDFKI